MVYFTTALWVSTDFEKFVEDSKIFEDLGRKSLDEVIRNIQRAVSVTLPVDSTESARLGAVRKYQGSPLIKSSSRGQLVSKESQTANNHQKFQKK